MMYKFKLVYSRLQCTYNVCGDVKSKLTRVNNRNIRNIVECKIRPFRQISI